MLTQVADRRSKSESWGVLNRVTLIVDLTERSDAIQQDHILLEIIMHV